MSLSDHVEAMSSSLTRQPVPGHDVNDFEDKKEGEMRYQDLEWICLLGKGAFADVYLARGTRSKTLYAVKVMKKPATPSTRLANAYRNEHNFLVMPCTTWHPNHFKI